MTASDAEENDLEDLLSSNLPKKKTGPNPEYYAHFNEAVAEFFSLAYLHSSKPTGSFLLLPLHGSKITTTASYYVAALSGKFLECTQDTFVADSAEVKAPATTDTSESQDSSNSNNADFSKSAVNSNGGNSNRGTANEGSSSQQETSLEESTSESLSDEGDTREIDLLDQIPGVYWSAQEKDKFFNCLARYTIHRADEFLPHLPDKSLSDIFTYCTLLKNELKRVSLSTYVDDGAGARVPVRVHPRSIRYSELPTAHEVDDEFLEYEEEQSIFMGNKDQLTATKRASRKNHVLGEYTAIFEPESASLIESREALKLSKLYRANQLFPIVARRQSCRLTFDTYVFLEQLVKVRTRQLLGCILSNKIPTLDPFNDGAGFLHGARVEIISSDVWRATLDRGMFETSAGVRSRHRDEKYPFLDQYWQKLIDSLHLLIEASHQTLTKLVGKLRAFSKINHSRFFHVNQFLHSRDVDVSVSDEDDYTPFADAAARGVLSSAAEDVPDDDVTLGQNKATEQAAPPSPLLSTANSSVLDTEQDKNVNRECKSEVHSDSESETSSGVDQIGDDNVQPNQNGNLETACVSSFKENTGIIGRQVSKSTSDSEKPIKTTPRNQWYHLSDVPKRTTQDYDFEDTLLDSEEASLELLDRKRENSYMRELQKRLKLNQPTDGADLSRASRIYTIRGNLNELWDKSFAFY